MKLQSPRDTFPIGHGNVIRAFEEGLTNAIKDLIRGLPDHDRIQIYLASKRLRNAYTRKRCCFGSDNYGELLRSKRSINRINNDDELCCARAIIVAKAVADDDERLKLIKDYRSNLQGDLARALHEEARVPIGP